MLHTFSQVKAQYWKYLWSLQKEGEKQPALLSLNDPQVIWLRLTTVQAGCTQGSTRGGQPTQLRMAVVSLIFTLPALLLCLGMCEREKILNPMADLSQQHLSQQISLSFSKYMESYSICQGTCHWHSWNAYSGSDGSLPSKSTPAISSGVPHCSCLKCPGKKLKEYEQSPKDDGNSNQKKFPIKMQLGLL